MTHKKNKQLVNGIICKGESSSITVEFRTIYLLISIKSKKASKDSRKLIIKETKLGTCGRRAFSVAGLMTFSALPDQLRLRDLTATSTFSYLEVFTFT